jgi:hypothetical protein
MRFGRKVIGRRSFGKAIPVWCCPDFFQHEAHFIGAAAWTYPSYGVSEQFRDVLGRRELITNVPCALARVFLERLVRSSSAVISALGTVELEASVIDPAIPPYACACKREPDAGRPISKAAHRYFIACLPLRRRIEVKKGTPAPSPALRRHEAFLVPRAHIISGL